MSNQLTPCQSSCRFASGYTRHSSRRDGQRGREGHLGPSSSWGHCTSGSPRSSAPTASRETHGDVVNQQVPVIESKRKISESAHRSVSKEEE